MQALALRMTSRDFATTELSMQTLSNLLWAAWGDQSAKGRPADGSLGRRLGRDRRLCRDEGGHVHL